MSVRWWTSKDSSTYIKTSFRYSLWTVITYIIYSVFMFHVLSIKINIFYSCLFVRWSVIFFTITSQFKCCQLSITWIYQTIRRSRLYEHLVEKYQAMFMKWCIYYQYVRMFLWLWEWAPSKSFFVSPCYNINAESIWSSACLSKRPQLGR